MAKEAEKEMSFLEHLEELRWHIVRSVLAIVILGIVVFIYIQWVFDQILYAPKQGSFITYRAFCAISERTCFEPPPLEIITVSLDEQFITAIKVAFWLGFIGAFPYIFYQFWKFIKPGLYDKEQKAVKGIVFICSLLFISGVLFGYFAIAPFAIKFLGSFTIGMDISNTVSLKSYISYMTMFTIPAGIMFELPIVIFFLSKIGLVTPKFLRYYRRHAYIIILILAAIITPPDVATQFMIGIPVMVLYEISILISARVQKNSLQT